MATSYKELAKRLNRLREEEGCREPSVESAGTLDRVAALFYDCGRFREARSIGEHVNDLCRKSSDTAGFVRSEVRIAHSLIHLGRSEEALARAERLLAETTSGAEYPVFRASATLLLAYTLMKRGEFDESLRLCSDAEGVISDDRLRSRLSFVRAWSLIGKGRFREAEIESGAGSSEAPGRAAGEVYQ